MRLKPTEPQGVRQPVPGHSLPSDRLETRVRLHVTVSDFWGDRLGLLLATRPHAKRPYLKLVRGADFSRERWFLPFGSKAFAVRHVCKCRQPESLSQDIQGTGLVPSACSVHLPDPRPCPPCYDPTFRNLVPPSAFGG